MKIEFNRNGFSADMEVTDSAKNDKFNTAAYTYLVKKSSVFICGAISVILALVLIPLSFAVNLITDIYLRGSEEFPASYLLLFLTLAIIFTAVSVIFSVISIVFYKKSEKKRIDIIGLVLSIFSFLICSVSLTLGIIAVFI